MKFSSVFFLIVPLLFSLVLQGQNDIEWRLVKNSDNIKAYVQKGPSSQLKMVKVETVLETSLSELVAIIKDAKNHKNWVFLNETAKMLEETDEFNWKYYGITDAPWPVYDRDFVTTVTLEQSQTDYSISIISDGIPNYLIENEEMVRIHYVHSVWVFNPLGNGTVHISFVLEADPGGNIPIWLINMAVSKGPYKTVEGLIKEIESGKYKCDKLNYIEEFVVE